MDHLAPGVKCFPGGKHLIYYRKTRKGTDIPHIFHGSRGQARAFENRPKRR